MARPKRTGFIDARRPTVGGISAWPQVPACLIPGQMQAYGIYDEFLQLQESGGVMMPTDWLLHQITNGLYALADAPGGVCVLVCDGTATDDCCQITYGGIDGAGAMGGAFWPSEDLDIFYEVLLMQHLKGTGNELNLAFGLIDPADAEYLNDAGTGMNSNDYICFLTLDDVGVTTNAWSFAARSAGGVASINALGVDLTDEEYHYFGFWVHGTPDGLANVYPFIDRVYQPLGLIAAATIPLVGLMPFVAIKDGSETDVGAEVYIDYCMCIQRRGAL